MTHGEMPLGWGWFSRNYNKPGKYFIVKVGEEVYLYQNRNGFVHEHTVPTSDSIPDAKKYPHFFLPVGAI